ncbi:MAG: hypothetical protein FJZ62_05050 [Chlamydiae bacterium]|nr:hypothetical protein [Chlamydiota bacterium]
MTSGDPGPVGGNVNQAENSQVSSHQASQGIALRADAVASALFFSAEFQPYRGTSSYVHSYTQSEKPESLEDLKKNYQGLANEINKTLGIEGLIQDFNLENGRLEFYEPGALNYDNRPKQGAKTKVLFVSQELKKINLSEARSLREKANRVLASHQKLIDENKKPPQPSTTPRKAFILGPKQFDIPKVNSFEGYPSDFVELQKILHCGDKRTPKEQVEWVIRYVTDLGLAITEESKNNAIRDYCLEFESHSPHPNIGKILAFLDISPDVFKKHLEAAIKVPLLFNRKESKEQQQKAIQRFIAECKGYSDKPELLDGFLQFFRGRSDFPYIVPTGFFKQEGGYEEFSDDKEMEELAEPYKEYKGLVKEVMTSRSTSSYRNAIRDQCPSDDPPVVLTAARKLEASIDEKSGTFDPKCTKDQLNQFESDGLHEMSGIKKSLDGPLIVEGETIGVVFRQIMKIYVSLKLLGNKKVLEDLSPKEIFDLFKKFVFEKKGITVKTRELDAAALAKLTDREAYWPGLSGENMTNAIKTAAFELFKANHPYLPEDVPQELVENWFDELKKTTALPIEFMTKKKAGYQAVKDFVEEKKSDIADREKAFLSLKLYHEYNPRFPGENTKNIDKLFTKLEDKKGQIRGASAGKIPALTPDDVLDLAIRTFDLNEEQTIQALRQQSVGTFAGTNPPR